MSEGLLETLARQIRELSGHHFRLDLRVEALEKRVYKLEDVVREILQRTAGIGQRVGTVPIVDGEDRTQRVREDQAKGEDVVAPTVDLDGGKRSDTGGV